MASQEAAIVGDVSYHEYRGLVLDPKERDEIAKNLGLHNKVLVLRNHGMVTCGESLEEALYLMHNLVSACESQIKMLPVGLDNISIMSNEAVEQVRSVVKSAGTQVQGRPEEVTSPSKSDGGPSKKRKIWDIEFEAQMRMLDNAVSVCCLWNHFCHSMVSWSVELSSPDRSELTLRFLSFCYFPAVNHTMFLFLPSPCPHWFLPVTFRASGPGTCTDSLSFEWINNPGPNMTLKSRQLPFLMQINTWRTISGCHRSKSWSTAKRLRTRCAGSTLRTCTKKLKFKNLVLLILKRSQR